MQDIDNNIMSSTEHYVLYVLFAKRTGREWMVLLLELSGKTNALPANLSSRLKYLNLKKYATHIHKPSVKEFIQVTSVAWP